MTEKTTKSIFTTILVEFNPETKEFEKGEIVPSVVRDLKQENEELKKTIELFDKNDFSRKLHDVIETNSDEKDAISMVVFMLTLGADPYFEKQPDKYTALYNALRLEKYEIADLLIKKGVDVNQPTSNGEQIVFRLIRNNSIKQLEFLLKNGLNLNVCSVDRSNNLPIGIAVLNKNVNIVKLFIEHGANVNKCDNDGYSPLYFAYIYNEMEIFKLLVEHGADVNKCYKDNNSLLYLSVLNKKMEMFKLLIEHGADVNKCDNDNKSLLYWAMYCNQMEMFKLLVEYGADVNKYDNDNKSLLCLSVVKEKMEMFKLLIEHEADVNKCDNDGYSPLYWAVYRNNMEMFKLLVEHGADVNKYPKDSNTPLMNTIKNRNFDMLKILIEKGADLNCGCLMSSGKKMNPLEFAVYHNDKKITKFLLLEKNLPYDRTKFTSSDHKFYKTVKKSVDKKGKKNPQIIEVTANQETVKPLNTTSDIIETTFPINGKICSYKGPIDSIPAYIKQMTQL